MDKDLHLQKIILKRFLLDLLSGKVNEKEISEIIAHLEKAFEYKEQSIGLLKGLEFAKNANLDGVHLSSSDYI